MGDATLLPPRTTKLERALEQSMARIGEAPHPIDTLFSPDDCPEDFLPFLAWALSVDDWDPEWDLATRRRIVAKALLVHRHKGTPGAVRLALEALGLENVRLREWFRQTPQGEPWTFQIDLDLISEPISENLWKAALRAVNNSKNLRSHLRGINVAAPVLGEVSIASALRSAVIATIRPAQITSAASDGISFGAPGLQTSISAMVWPRHAPAHASGVRAVIRLCVRPFADRECANAIPLSVASGVRTVALLCVRPFVARDLALDAPHRLAAGLRIIIQSTTLPELS